MQNSLSSPSPNVGWTFTFVFSSRSNSFPAVFKPKKEIAMMQSNFYNNTTNTGATHGMVCEFSDLSVSGDNTSDRTSNNSPIEGGKHFVDFSRLNTVAVAAQHQSPNSPCCDCPSCRSTTPPAVIQVSRFAPPAPPSAKTAAALQNPNAFYSIVMRWYEKVVQAYPAHQSRGIPPCPLAEDFYYDFDGWLIEIDNWWSKHFGTVMREAVVAPKKRQPRVHYNKGKKNNNQF